jgi:hypothetical protein
MWACPNASEARPMWLRYEWRGRREVDDIRCVGFWKVVGLRCGPWELVQRWGGGVHMNKGRVGEDRGSKETDGCPLTASHYCDGHMTQIFCDHPYNYSRTAVMYGDGVQP